ncbi:MAG TPA: protein kinase, partial [Planctomycetota bacterium]|nr:protein kinase [Planctomycetota bacterium]
DVYALGAILYELLTGRPPFQSTGVMETIRQVLEDPVPAPSTLRPGIPAGLERFILKALEKEKRNRYPTASAFARTLEAVLREKDAPPSVERPAPATALAEPPKPVRSASKILFWALVLLVLSLLSGVGVLHLLKGAPVVGK